MHVVRVLILIVTLGISKLGNLLFTRELQRKLSEEGISISVLAVDPGAVASSQWSNKFGDLL
jgi:NAD(P)-dependent dehydrogenase (short-subunit alcohol dehydrogenase family)